MSSNKPKNALVTGAAKRVGREIAINLAKQGWNVAIHHHTSNADEVVAECQSHGVKAVAIQADLNSYLQTREVILQANQALGEITLLVNNASIFEQCSFADTEEDIFDRHMNINFKAPFFLSQDFAKQSKNAGHIVNICDTNTRKRKTTYFAYLLSKKTFRDFSKMLAMGLAPSIRVNTIMPGAVKEYLDNASKDFIEQRMPVLPMQELAKIEDILEAILYLENSNLTGQEIFLDGGEQLL